MAGKILIPVLSETTNYTQWKRELKLWKAATQLPDEKMAPNVVLCMVGKPKQIGTQMSVDELVKKERS